VSTTEQPPEVFSGPLGGELRRRLLEVTGRARRLLGVEPAVAAAPGRAAEELRELASALATGLDHAGGVAAPLAAEHAAALERLRQRYESRFDALARVQAVLAELRNVTAPAEMLGRAPAVLCRGSTFSRAILSLVRGGAMVAEVAHFEGDAGGAKVVLEQLRADPPRLEHPLLETELLRRRRATIVVDAQVHPGIDRRMAKLMGWKSYAAAPLLFGADAVGVIHADRGRHEGLDVLDRDVLWEFASGLAQAYESASLRRTLRQEREQMRAFLEWLNARSAAMSDAALTLDPSRPAAPSPPEPLDRGPGHGTDDRLVFQGLLTRRELEVLRLMAEGNTNRAIADALVIADGTVKFHVNGILRKLHVANRAEAVSRYLRLLGIPAP
jgi:LuxR family transcriptional regulator, regulator of acetate metabolism